MRLSFEKEVTKIGMNIIKFSFEAFDNTELTNHSKLGYYFLTTALFNCTKYCNVTKLDGFPNRI